ncbi:MAG: GspH/FimT family pseudopilin [Smithella sp.]
MKIKSTKGFSLIEILIVIAIMAILLSIAAPNFNAWRQNRNLNEAVGALMGDLNFARQSAITQNVNYKVTFNNTANTYTVQGGTYNATKNLSNFGSGTFIYSQNFNSSTVTFQPRGTLSGIGGTVSLKNSRNSCINIVVNTMGRVRKDIQQIN